MSESCTTPPHPVVLNILEWTQNSVVSDNYHNEVLWFAIHGIYNCSTITSMIIVHAKMETCTISSLLLSPLGALCIDE